MSELRKNASGALGFYSMHAPVLDQLWDISDNESWIPSDESLVEMLGDSEFARILIENRAVVEQILESVQEQSEQFNKAMRSRLAGYFGGFADVKRLGRANWGFSLNAAYKDKRKKNSPFVEIGYQWDTVAGKPMLLCFLWFRGDGAVRERVIELLVGKGFSSSVGNQWPGWHRNSLVFSSFELFCDDNFEVDMNALAERMISAFSRIDKSTFEGILSAISKN